MVKKKLLKSKSFNTTLFIEFSFEFLTRMKCANEVIKLYAKNILKAFIYILYNICELIRSIYSNKIKLNHSRIRVKVLLRPQAKPF